MMKLSIHNTAIYDAMRREHVREQQEIEQRRKTRLPAKLARLQSAIAAFVQRDVFCRVDVADMLATMLDFQQSLVELEQLVRMNQLTTTVTGFQACRASIISFQEKTLPHLNACFAPTIGAGLRSRGAKLALMNDDAVPKQFVRFDDGHAKYVIDLGEKSDVFYALPLTERKNYLQEKCDSQYPSAQSAAACAVM